MKSSKMNTGMSNQRDLMMFTTLIDCETLKQHIEYPDWRVVDCRFTLADPGQGQRDYEHGHIPKAVYAHLDKHLSVPQVPGVTGRHPLPSVEAAAEHIASPGIAPGMQVVAYDDAGGASAAVRLWWMLRWLGHRSVAILDGGWQAWLGQGYPVLAGLETAPPARFEPEVHPELLVEVDELQDLLHNPGWRVFDARSFERYQGLNETIDPVAGHIPGAWSAPYAENLQADGRFKPRLELRQRYLDLLGAVPAHRAVFYCGSGVTAIHDILAMEYTGLAGARLYAGSWSEWIVDPLRPVATSGESGS
jgi:thiosulfate/3-mercaptopyruvate sulfurtransferase